MDIVDSISLIKTEVLATLVARDFGESASASEVEAHFVEFVSNGEGSYEDYPNVRTAWRDFVETTGGVIPSEDAEDDVTIVGYVSVQSQVESAYMATVLTAEHQMGLF